jgi:hypothetical protein
VKAPQVAAILVVPALMPVTTPLFTTATAEFWELHSIVPVAPAGSRMASSRAVDSTVMDKAVLSSRMPVTVTATSALSSSVSLLEKENYAITMLVANKKNCFVFIV